MPSRERHARGAATLLAQQRQREHVLLQRLVRSLQARHSETEFLHGLLVGRGIALCVYVRCKGLLVVPGSRHLLLIVAAASSRAPVPLIREAGLPIRIGGIATVPFAKCICQMLRVGKGQDPRGISSVSVIGPHLA